MAMVSNDIKISPTQPPAILPPPPLNVFNRPPYNPWSSGSGRIFPPAITYNNSGNSGSSSSSTYTRFFTVAVVCLCVVSSMVLFLHLYLRYVRRQHMRRHRHQTTNLLRLSTFNLRSDSMRAGLDRDEISSIPSYQYQRDQAYNNNMRNSTGSMAGADCAVCLSALEEGEVVRMLPACRHIFHVACIDKWLTSKASCPVCRADVSAQTQAQAPAQPAQAQSTGTNVSDVPVQEQSGTKEETEAGTSVSTRLSSSFRRMLSSNRSSTRRVQDDHTAVEDLERGDGTTSNNNN